MNKINKEKVLKALKNLAPLFIIVASGLIIDRLTKIIAENNLKYEGNSVPIIKGLFSWTLVYNEGAAWSLFTGQFIFLYIFTVIALVAIVAIYLKSDTIWARLALSLITAGACGNFFDRLFFQKVVDFIQFHPFDFPIFNFADILIVCGVGLFFYYLIFIDGKKKKDE